MSRKLGSQYQAHDNVIRFAVLTLPRILQHVSGNARTWRTAATTFWVAREVCTVRTAAHLAMQHTNRTGTTLTRSGRY